MCVTSTLAAEAEAEVVGDADVDASAASTSADGGLDGGGHGSKEKDPPNVRRKGATVEWRASNRRRMSIPTARRTLIFQWRS